MKKNSLIWSVCCGMAVFLTALAYSPLVLSPDQFEPVLFGMPRTFWAGIVIYLVFLVVIWLGTQVHPEKED